MKLLRLGWAGAFIFAALVYPVAWIIAGTSTEAWEISPHDPSIVKLLADMFKFDAPDANAAGYREQVMSIYGNPGDKAQRWLFVPEERFIHPKEMPTLTLLPVDRIGGENPFQLKTLYFISKWAVVCSAGTGILLLGLWLLLRRRRRRKPPPPEPVSS